LYIRVNKLDTAVEDLTNAIKFNPYYSEAYFRRGGVYFLKSKLKAAITDYNNAIFINPSNGGYYNNRGLAYENMGNTGNMILPKTWT